MHVNLQVVAGAEDVLAEKVLRARLVEGFVQELRALRHLAADVEVGELHVVRPAGENHALDELVRVLVDDLAVLERAWLGLVGVTNEVDGLAGLAVHERPLDARAEARATATAQTGGLHVLAHLLLRRKLFAVGQIPGHEREPLLERVVAAVAKVALHVRRVTGLVGVLEN